MREINDGEANKGAKACLSSSIHITSAKWTDRGKETNIIVNERNYIVFRQKGAPKWNAFVFLDYLLVTRSSLIE